MSPADNIAHMDVVQTEGSKEPRKVFQVGEQLVNKDISDSPSNISQYQFRTGLRDLHPWPRSKRDTGSKVPR